MAEKGNAQKRFESLQKNGVIDDDDRAFAQQYIEDFSKGLIIGRAEAAKLKAAKADSKSKDDEDENEDENEDARAKELAATNRAREQGKAVSFAGLAKAVGTAIANAQPHNVSADARGVDADGGEVFNSPDGSSGPTEPFEYSYSQEQVGAFVSWLNNEDGSLGRAQRVGLSQADLADMYRTLTPKPTTLEFGQPLQGATDGANNPRDNVVQVYRPMKQGAPSNFDNR